MDALIQLGMVSEQLPSEAQNSATSVSEAKDYFVSRDGVKFAVHFPFRGGHKNALDAIFARRNRHEVFVQPIPIIGEFATGF